MARYAQDQPVTVSTEVRLAPVAPATVGALTDPGAILLRVKKPDGTFLADYSSPTRDSQGKFHQDLPTSDLSLLGIYRYLWKTTGAAAGANPVAGSFTVIDPFLPSHLDIGDVRRRLNLTSSDDELLDMMASAVSEQEQRVGPVAPRTVTETVTAYGGRLSLSSRPVLSVTSALAGLVSTSVAAWSVPSPLAGLVQSTSYLSGTFTVTYVAGRNPVPQDLVEAALLRVQHSYETQRGSADTAFTDVTEGSGGSAFLLLLRAQDKEKPYILPNVA